MSRVICGRYEVGECLGVGMSGKVYLGVDMVTGDEVALKLLDKKKILDSSREMRNLRREIGAMSDVANAAVVKLLAVDWDATLPSKRGGAGRDVIALVLELCTGGELFDFMMYSGALPENVARTYFKQLLTSLRDCHAAGIVHRDIKAENLLLDSHFCLKIADFGLSSPGFDDDGNPTMLRTKCGTKNHMAPEILARRAYSGAAADVWSSGVVLFIMLAGFPPFGIANRTDWWFLRLLREVERPLFWEAHLRSATFSAGARSIIDTIFVAEPSERATIDQLLEHPWVASGEILSAEQLCNTLSELKETVRAAKRAELASRMSENEAKMDVASGDGTPVDDYDIFDASPVRGTHSPPAPIAPRRNTCQYTSFYVDAPSAKSVLDRIEQSLNLMSATYATRSGEYVTKAEINDGGETIKVTSRIYSVADSPLHLVSIQRRNGNSVKFHKAYSSLRLNLTDIMTVSPE